MLYFLDKLIRMEVVERRWPINDEKNKRKAGYYILDYLSLFYYRYIFRYSSQLSVMDPELFYDRYVKEDFENGYVPGAFEGICRQYLIRQNRRGRLEEPFEKIGKFWYDDPILKKNGEFDIVTWDPKGYIFYEAKFRREPVSTKMIEAEIARVKAAGLGCYKYGFINRAGFTAQQAENQIFITLDDLYAAEL